MPATIQIKYFNSFWLKKVVTNATSGVTGGGISYAPVFPGLENNPTGYPTFPGLAEQNTTMQQKKNWIIEEARIRGGYNNTNVDYGVRAYLTEDSNDQSVLGNSLIYSGIFNSRTDVNETNFFSTADEITKSVNPANGSIQRLFSENSNLTIFQENKVNTALINKDAIYSAEGSGTAVSSTRLVIGQITPYAGKYGISKNPESFANYGFRKYFADKNRGVILRLSRDGITEISKNGMSDYFRDELASISDDWQSNTTPSATFVNQGNFVDSISVTRYYVTINATRPQIEKGMAMVVNGSITPFKVVSITNNYTRVYLDNNPGTITANAALTFISYGKDKIIGTWDIHQKNYTLSTQHAPINTYDESADRSEVSADTFKTLSFDESVLGWTSFYSYRPILAGSLKSNYYTFNDSKLYMHYDQSIINNRGNFYGTTTPSSITFIFNANPSITKNFNTVSYEGSNGWEADYFISDTEQANREWSTSNPSSIVANGFIDNQDKTNKVYSYLEGTYETATPANTGTNAVTPPFSYAGFSRKENRYVSNMVNNSTVRAGEVIYGNQVSGIKGYFATVKLSTDLSTQPGGMKELFSVSTNYVLSSY